MRTAKEIFLAAMEIPRQSEREAFVAGACGGEEELFREVSQLLEAHFEHDSWLAASKLNPQAQGRNKPAGDETSAFADLRAGSQVGPYKLLEQIGAGGMGIVFMAEQLKPIRRKVAVKIIKPGMDTRQVVARFEAERQALALMDHPNIAHVLDAGSTDSGRPYFVMELVRGIPITEYCDRNRLDARERLKLFTAVCQAVQHAHTKGIIHRDIKPSNVLVTLHDGVPIPKIIDFGVAKAINQQLTEQTLFTSFAQFVGTPLYMSPEQAEMSGLDVDTRSDIYSLGVLLYELLTGTTPFDGKRLQLAALDELRRIIREEEPPKPSTRVSTLGTASVSTSTQRSTDPLRLKQLLQRELDWIVMKTLEKDRTRRYETVNALIAEVRRYLEGQPVEACPPSVTYRLRKMAYRHKTWVAGVSSFLILLLGSSILAWVLFVQARRARDQAIAAQSASIQERDRARESERKAALHLNQARQEKVRADNHAHELRQKLYDYNIIKANAAYRDRRFDVASGLLLDCSIDQRGWEWFYLDQLTKAPRSIPAPDKSALPFVFSSDSRHIVSVSSAGEIRWIRIADGQEQWRQNSEVKNSTGIAISPEGDHLLITGHQPKSNSESSESDVGIMEMRKTSNGELLWRQAGNGATVYLPTFRQDGAQFLLTLSDAAMKQSEIQLRSSVDGQLLWSTPARNVAQAIFDQPGERVFITEAKEQNLVSGSRIRCLDATNRRQIWQTDRPRETSGICLSPDGAELLATGSDVALVRYEMETGKERSRHSSRVAEEGFFLCVDGPGNRVATISRTGAFVVWDWRNKLPVETNRDRSFPLNVQFSPDGDLIAYFELEAGGIRVRPTRKPAETLELIGHSSGFKGARFLDEHRLCSVGSEGAWRNWNTSTGKELKGFSLGAEGLELDATAEGQWLATATTKGTMIWEGGTGNLAPGNLVQHFSNEGQTWFVKFDAAGNVLASAGKAGILHIYEATPEESRSGNGPPKRSWRGKIEKPLHALNLGKEIQGLALSAEGDTVYTLTSPGCEVLAWSVGSGGRRVLRPAQLGEHGRVLSLSPDQRFLAAGIEHQVEMWDLARNRLAKTLRGPVGRIMSIAFDRTGKRLFAGSVEGAITVWNVETEELLMTFKAHPRLVVCLDVARDNRKLASTGFDGEIKLWETRALSPEMQQLRDQTQLATLRANELLVRHKTARAAIEQLAKDDSFTAELMPLVLEALQARIDTPVKLTTLAEAIAKSTGATAEPETKRIADALALKEKIEAAIGDDLLVLRTPTVDLPNDLLAERWHQLTRNLANPTRHQLDAATMISLLEVLTEPEETPHYLTYLKANVHLNLGQWKEAEVEFTRAITRIPPKSPLWLCYAFRLSFLRAYLGKVEEYNALCKEALEHHAGVTHPVDIERLAKMGLFTNLSTIEPQRFSELMERAPRLEATGPNLTFAMLTQGLAELRKQQYEPALAHFVTAGELGFSYDKQGNAISIATAKMYASIACARLGRSEEAQKYFEEAAPTIRALPPGTGWWPDWLIGELAMREAEELLKTVQKPTP